MFKARIGFWAVLVLSLLIASPTWAQNLLIIPAPGQQPDARGMPPHVAECFNNMALYRGFALYRLADISQAEAEGSVDLSLRILDYTVRSRGVVPKKPLAEYGAEIKGMLAEVYDLEPFGKESFEEWVSAGLRTCIEENAPPPPDKTPKVAA